MTEARQALLTRIDSEVRDYRAALEAEIREKCGELSAAEVLHTSARDFYGGAGQWYAETITVHLRTPRTFSPALGLRVLWQGRAYDVVEVTPDKPLRDIAELRAAAADMEGSEC